MKLENWDLIKCIGKGSFGRVYKAVSQKDGSTVAVKFEKKNAEYPQLRYEHRVYGLLRNIEGIPKTYGSVGSHRNYNYFVMDYYPIDLQKLFAKKRNIFTKEFVHYVIHSLVSILESIHDMGIIHRDLKPGNMMYDNVKDKIVLIDMGLSKRSASEENEKLEEDVSLIGLLYIKLYEDHKDDLSPSEGTLNKLNDLHESVKTLGSIPEKVSAVIRKKFLSILQYKD